MDRPGDPSVVRCPHPQDPRLRTSLHSWSGPWTKNQPPLLPPSLKNQGSSLPSCLSKRKVLPPPQALKSLLPVLSSVASRRGTVPELSYELKHAQPLRMSDAGEIRKCQHSPGSEVIYRLCVILRNSSFCTTQPKWLIIQGVNGFHH